MCTMRASLCCVVLVETFTGLKPQQEARLLQGLQAVVLTYESLRCNPLAAMPYFIVTDTCLVNTLLVINKSTMNFIQFSF